MRLPYPTLIMMLSDAPRYVSGHKDKPVRITSKEQLFGLLSQKQTN
nr:MAG TPA: hypothetical protein [Caudoviricetes sp.]